MRIRKGRKSIGELGKRACDRLGRSRGEEKIGMRMMMGHVRNGWERVVLG